MRYDCGLVLSWLGVGNKCIDPTSADWVQLLQRSQVFGLGVPQICFRQALIPISCRISLLIYELSL